jgi:diguanylate cyclase (GGDEF)-like protein
MQAAAQTQHIQNFAEQFGADILNKILEGKYITPVYQPIVSLTNGEVFGYEALSRISNKDLEISIEEMFNISDRTNRAWELETLCRKKALENAKSMDAEKKLFLNVNPNIIHDAEFKDGFTKKRLEKYGLNFQNIVFEVSERTAVINKKAFLDSIEHYRNQNYEIAIDDIGSGYSGLNAINDVKPDIIKLDMNLVRNIDKDETKHLLCKAMIDFGKNAEIKVIAEGIETEEELHILIKLGVDLGQGYFLGIPQKSFAEIAPEKIEIIKKCNYKKFTENSRSSVYPIAGHLSKNSISHATSTDFLKVNYNMPIDQVSRFAMQRPFERLYDPIVVEKEGKYFGIVTIKDLLEAYTKIELDEAMYSNPLTKLPGNLLIEKKITDRIFGTLPYCITYYNLDNFKAYKNAYGFHNGDLMLVLVAEILKKVAVKNEFVGHIGDDDFIVICDYHEGEEFCKAVIKEFSSRITSLYRDEDIENGYIISKNRQGVTENFPLASLSIAGISNRTKTYQSLDDFSNDVAKIKKKCKQQRGNCFEIF